MSEKRERKKVLAIHLKADVYEKVAPLLDRRDFQVDLFPRASHALEILSLVAFDALLAGYPLPNGSAKPLLDALRAEGSLNRSTPLIFLCDAGFEAEAESWVGRGASRIIPMADAPDRVQLEVSKIVDIAPRSDLRFMLRMKVQLEDGSQLALGQTDNVSRTGMLVTGGEAYPLGSKLSFEFFLGNESSPVSGQGVVVRHTTPGRESMGGMGIRFDDFEKDGKRRLERYLDRLESDAAVG
ncbi:MAG: PilZ domain-containing protein [Thermoanaerobaculia bacterium]|nr:PilZ domain-containing protein [Thermoanaerobaculia bacterium]